MKGIFLFVKWRVSDLCRNLNFRFGHEADADGRFKTHPFCNGDSNRHSNTVDDIGYSYARETVCLWWLAICWVARYRCRVAPILAFT